MTRADAERIVLIFERRCAEGCISRELADRCSARAREDADRDERTCVRCFRLDCGDTCAPERWMVRYSWIDGFEVHGLKSSSEILRDHFGRDGVTVLRAQSHAIGDCVLLWVQFPDSDPVDEYGAPSEPMWPGAFHPLPWYDL